MSGLVAQVGARSGVVGFNTPKRHQYSPSATGWSSYDVQGQTSSEQGIMVQNMGKIWIVNCSIKGANVGIGSGNVVLVNIANEFTAPDATVICGTGVLGWGTQVDFSSNIQITDSGNIYLYYHNDTGNDFYSYNTFVGLDVS